MSQDKSLMFSDVVYLFGNTFCLPPPPSKFDSEELPNGTKVNQGELAVWVVLAAFAYLYQKQLIDIVLGERKGLFSKNKTATVKTHLSSAPDLSGVEAVIYSTLQRGGVSEMYDITTNSIPWLTPNLYGWVLKIVKKNLVQRGIVKRVVKRKGLFITTYKYVVSGDMSPVEKQVTELQKTLKELQAQGELYQHMITDIDRVFVSRLYTGD